MPLAAGTHLGPYEITEQIGVGGMGEVYRARDTNLGRDVAIKVLPEVFAQDADRLARFEREAKTLASLSHPNIAIVHGFEKTGDVRALVMELVEGPTLADLIEGDRRRGESLDPAPRRSIPIDEALSIARQIAEALEAAHEQGIVHRDLKPANVKVRDDGTVKVLDFGLAKMMEASGAGGAAEAGGAGGVNWASASMSPTITTPAMTQLGVILGTAAYMAPEQARGKPVDKRSDIWAFGCVLFEMLAGTRAFDGEDATDTIAAVVRAEPKWDALPADVPSHIRLLLRRCLEKDRKKRIGDISTAIFVMSEQASGAAATLDAARDATTPHRHRRGRYLAWSAAAVAAATMTTAGVVWTATRPTPPLVSRLELNTSGDSKLALYTTNTHVSITRDGSRVIYLGGTLGAPPGLFVRRLDQLEPTQLAERGAYSFVSPDGRWVGFTSQNLMRKVAITGGASLDVVRMDGQMRGATWGSDDTIVFATTGPETGLFRVASGGGDPTVLTRPNQAKGEGDHVLPRWLPGGTAVLFTITANVGPADSSTSQIAVLDLRSPGAAPKILLRGGADARYLPTGHLVYLASGSLWTVPFDVDRLEVQEAAPLPVLPSVASTGGVNTIFDVSDNGTLIYLSASSISSPERQLVWVDRAGKEEVIPAPPKPYVYPRLSPDGTRIAVDVREQENDIWVWDLVRRGFTRVTTHSGLDRAPLWLNGEQIVYSAMMSGNPSLFLQRSDGTGRPEQLAIGGSTAQFPLSLSPDGKRVVFLSANAQGNDLMMLQLDRPASTKVADAASATTAGGYTSSLRDVQLLVDDAGAQANGVISPDGRWFAYQSSESGTFEIYVRPFADTKEGIRQTVSNDSGTQPRWSPDGRELFYVSLRNNAMMGVRISGGDTWSAGTPEKLFDASRYSLGPVYPYFNYDLAKDGRFLLTKPLGASASEPESSASLVVVQNWFEELKRLVAK